MTSTFDKLMQTSLLENSEEFADLCSKAEGNIKTAQAILKFVSTKISSASESEALQALHILEQAVSKSGPKFKAELGKFRFLNDLIKLTSSLHHGNSASLKVRDAALLLLSKWSSEFKNQPNITEAYNMMKQKVIPMPSSAEKFKAQQSQGEGETMDADNAKPQLLEKSNTWAALDPSTEIPEFDIYPVWRRKLRDYGLNETVIDKLEESFRAGKLIFNDLDTRALDALKFLPMESAVDVLDQFMQSNLEHVYNKSAYLCGIMKTFKIRANVPSTKVMGLKGPDESKINSVLSRTGYTLDVTTGQRKYGGPPPNWEGPPPGTGCEIFVGKIPKDIYEDNLVPFFESCGEIWDMRLIMDPLTGHNRGFAFITYTDKEYAQKAIKELDGAEFKSGKYLRVTASIPNIQLFVGNIPKSKGRLEILEEFTKVTNGLKDVIVYNNPDDLKKKNRGFCFLQYENHRLASMAKRKLAIGRTRIWGCNIIVDWADPQENPDEETMSKVKVLYVSNLVASISEDSLRNIFEQYGRIEHVKKLRDYAFVHFEKRDEALQAMEDLHKKDLGHGVFMSVSLAKPALDSKKKEEMLRNRERRMMQTMQQRSRMMGVWPTFGQPPPFSPPPESIGIQSRMQSRNSLGYYNEPLDRRYMVDPKDRGEPLADPGMMDGYYYPETFIGSSNSRGHSCSMNDGFGRRDSRMNPKYEVKYEGRRIFSSKSWGTKQEVRLPMRQRPLSNRRAAK